MHKGLKEPHLLNAGPNPFRLIKNLAGLLLEVELDKIRAELIENAARLFKLGESHFNFARSIPPTEWRQRASRFYYGAYNARRAVALIHDGSFSTDSSDHKNADAIPDVISNAAVYRQKLKDLRDDRNIADYSHLAGEGDLLIRSTECETIVADFFVDARTYLVTQGVNV